MSTKYYERHDAGFWNRVLTWQLERLSSFLNKWHGIAAIIQGCVSIKCRCVRLQDRHQPRHQSDSEFICNDHAAFASGCGPYLVRMIHGKKARPIQKDGTLQRFLLSGLGPAPTVGQPWGDPPGASTCDDHAAFASGCGPDLVRMIHGKKARTIQKLSLIHI